MNPNCTWAYEENFTLVFSKIVFCLVLTIKQSLILLCNRLLDQCIYILHNQN